jgi:type IV pilus assembly protein PilA
MKKLVRSNISNQSGFTLIELLVVIAIIGILAAIVLIGLNPAQRINEANTSKVQADVRQAASIVETCITKELGLGSTNAQIYSTAVSGCGLTSYLTGASAYARIIPTGILFSGNSSTPVLCVYEGAGTQSYWYSTVDGKVSTPKPVSCP